MPKSDEHYEELDRLWRGITRELSSSILEFAGVKDGKASERLMAKWKELCDHDLDMAAQLYHGIEQIHTAMGLRGKPNSPDEHRMRQLNEIVGMAEIAREKHPEAKADTLNDLMSIADESVRNEIDAETDELGKGGE